ncbi:homeobox protein Hox-C5a-like [Notothenia coriiceps]|uniref:Homeobox protein Hox-C5a-like n=1 Tax=Notothenia coriiceps TaxID=8208 RepID=A0A6I9P3U1_9TELE|nr:PREDICTED: homeobox protein Hox-C5a-like [Notothenia coriiceps]
MSSYVDSCNLRQTSETTSPDTMFSFDLSGRPSSHYEGVNVNGIFTCPVPTTSVEREEMKTSLRGITDTPLPSGPQITMVSSSSSMDSSGLNYGSSTLLGRGVDRDPERSAKSVGNKNHDSERNAENTQTVKRHTNVNQRQDSEQRPQIYPWMTKLHMSHGKNKTIEQTNLSYFEVTTTNQTQEPSSVAEFRGFIASGGDKRSGWRGGDCPEDPSVRKSENG